MPCLNNYDRARQELESFYAAGGRAIVDCQPGFAGRDGSRLRSLSQATQVKIVASTGFHLQKYYPRNHWLFAAERAEAGEFFVRELTEGLTESLENSDPIPAGQIKAACPAEAAAWPKALLAAAAQAARQTGATVQVHTERGAGALEILRFFEQEGLDPRQLILAHMDKRADFDLHRELIQAGALVEYDTFSCAKYRPEENVWPLLFDLLAAGLEQGIAIANDLAYMREWRAYGGAPGLASLPQAIVPRLISAGLDPTVIDRLTFGNILGRLARPVE